MVYDATKPPRPCPTDKTLPEVVAEESFRDIEDCLTLSIHTPNTSGRYPVMFYIHGEFFFDGNSEEAQPEYLLEKDIVLVSVQYRLAPFGFLSTLSEKIPGNIAAMDVLLALDWVHNHIKYFGGNEKEITLFGQGAGASLAHLLMITPLLPEQIFHRVILQSGSMLSPYVVTDTPIDHARGIARYANCRRIDSVDEINNCLIRLKPSVLIEAFRRHCQSQEEQGIGHYGGFQWTVGDPFKLLPQHPSKLIRSNANYHYPVMAGVTRNVGSFFYKRQIHERLSQQGATVGELEEFVDVVLKHTIGEDEFGIWKTLVIENLFEAYRTENSTLRNISPGLIDLVSDILYKGPILQAMQLNAKSLPNDTFLYSFNYKGQHSRYFGPGPLPQSIQQLIGVSLSDDNIYLFPYPEHCANLYGKDLQMARTMVDYWTSFATTGIPSSSRDEDAEWPPMMLVTGPYLIIDRKTEVRFDFIEEFTRSLQDAGPNAYND